MQHLAAHTQLPGLGVIWARLKHPLVHKLGDSLAGGLQNQLVQAQAPPVNLSHVIGAGWVEPLLPIHAHDN